MKTVFFILFVLFSLETIGQVKIEREYRVNSNEVPLKAVQWIDSTFQLKPSKIKLYNETNGNKQSFEAKLRWLGETYSVEFDSQGNIEDIEINIKWQKLPENTKRAINQHLKSNYISFKIIKIQQQLVGSPNNLHLYIRESSISAVTIKYEMEIRGSIKSQNEIWEILFDSNGEFLSVNKVILNPSLNLDF